MNKNKNEKIWIVTEKLLKKLGNDATLTNSSGLQLF